MENHRLMASFEELLLTEPNRTWGAAEVSRSLGVSDRLLRRTCRACVGHGPAELSQAAPASLRPSRLASFSQQPHERRGGGTAVWLPQPESPLCCLSSTVRRAAIAYFATRPPWGASAADAADLATAPCTRLTWTCKSPYVSSKLASCLLPGGSMAISSVLTFTEPDQMEAAHAAARAEVVPTARERLAWHVTRVELDDLWLVRVQESGPRIRYVELDPERTFLSFLVRPGPDVFVRGVSRSPYSADTTRPGAGVLRADQRTDRLGVTVDTHV